MGEQESFREEDRVYTLNRYVRETFGGKLYRLSLDGGFTCPNRDGRLGTGGCIFCSEGGSGDFASSRLLSVSDQLKEAKEKLRGKFDGNRYIAYFQAFTGTYAPVDRLRSLYREALADPEVEVLSIATRPDCFSDEIYELLKECRSIKPVWIELGMQTAREDTAAYIRRGYPLPVLDQTVARLHALGIPVILHLILGLPGEGKEDWLASVRHVNLLHAEGVKLSLLHILKGTDLYEEYLAGKVRALSQEEYIDGLCACLRILSPDTVVHRMTGDGPKRLLAAPLWSADKKKVMNEIRRQLKLRDIRQGMDR